MYTADKSLILIEQELRFIARHSRAIRGGCGADLEAVDEINMAVEAALKALREYNSRLRPVDGDNTDGALSTA